jgi:GNAT superfamily N-acetyltransferase
VAVTLRPAQPDDVTAVGHLHYRSRCSAYRDIVPESALTAVPADAIAGWWVERWSYERDTHLLTVAETDGTLAGFTYVGPDEDGDPAPGELYAIHVDDRYHGRGVGTALIRDALDTMRRRRYLRGTLWVITANQRARRFYERGGWQPDGGRRDGWIGPVSTPQLRYAQALTGPSDDI